ncbi:MAG: hypothetical protein IKO49_02835 [Bacilli bacterium]|nr:hypothetical protein [Bacilli bacterium]
MKKEKWQKYKKTDTKLFPQLLLIFIIILSTSCEKNGFNKKQFTEIVEKNNFIVTDIEEKEYVETLAVSSHYQISLYTYDKNKDANNAYKDKIKYYKDKKVNIKHKNNYLFIENKYVYTIIYKTNNYIIETEVPKTYKQEVIKLMKKLNLTL